MTTLLTLILIALVVIILQLYFIKSTVELQFTKAIRQIELAQQSFELKTLDTAEDGDN
jgi:hypothetical protein